MLVDFGNSGKCSCYLGRKYHLYCVEGTHYASDAEDIAMENRGAARKLLDDAERYLITLDGGFLVAGGGIVSALAGLTLISSGVPVLAGVGWSRLRWARWASPHSPWPTTSTCETEFNHDDILKRPQYFSLH